MSGPLLFAGTARAQSAPQPTPEQRRQAGAAFDQAVAARASGDHSRSADFFETANRLAPSAQALGNAIREHREVHSPAHDARAATLALRLRTQYGGDARMSRFAEGVLHDLAGALDRVTVSCQGCDLEVDHALTSDAEFFLEPGAHSVVATWTGNRTQSRDLQSTAGGTDTVTLEPPAAQPTSGTSVASGGAASGPAGGEEHPPPVVGGSGGDNTGTPREAPRGGLSPALFVVGAVATVGLGATLAWSVVDMYGGVPAYMANPTAQGLADGQGRELRTDVLIAATAVVGAATLTTLIFTRWGGPRRVSVEAAPTVVGSAGLAPGLSVAGRF